MMWLLLSLVSVGAEFEPPTPKPVPEIWDVSECSAMNLRVGQPPPMGLIGKDGNVRCRGTVVAVSDLKTLHRVQVWADAQHKRYVLDHNIWVTRETKYRADIAALSVQPKWYQRPKAHTVLGIALGVGAGAAVIAISDIRYLGWRRLDASSY